MPGAPASSGLGGSLQIVLDHADNLYATWLENDKLWLSISRDRAKTWSKPQVVSAPGVKNIELPAPAAGASGQFGLVYYYGSTEDQPKAKPKKGKAAAKAASAKKPAAKKPAAGKSESKRQKK